MTPRRILRGVVVLERVMGSTHFKLAASKHIKALEGAGLIRRDVRGTTHLCRLDPGPLVGAHQWLGAYERFWTDNLDGLERLLRDENARKAPPSKGDGS